MWEVWLFNKQNTVHRNNIHCDAYDIIQEVKKIFLLQNGVGTETNGMMFFPLMKALNK